MATADPEAEAAIRKAFAEASQMGNLADREKAMAIAIWQTLTIDPALTPDAYLEMESGSSEKNSIIAHFATRLAENHLEQARLWADSLKTEEERSIAFGDIALVIAQKDPSEAAQILSDSGVASRDFDVKVVQVVSRWSADNPADAAAWVTRFDKSEAREAGIKQVTSAWISEDPKKAFDWIASLSNDEIREDAVNGMAQTMLELPEQEQQNMLGLSSPEIRQRFEEMKKAQDDEISRPEAPEPETPGN